MQVFDNLSLCQKRTWAVKNDIKLKGTKIDNPTLSENCNEDDFFSPVILMLTLLIPILGLDHVLRKLFQKQKIIVIYPHSNLLCPI